MMKMKFKAGQIVEPIVVNELCRDALKECGITTTMLTIHSVQQGLGGEYINFVELLKYRPDLKFHTDGFKHIENLEQLNQARRQSIIKEVTDACEVFEKYDIRRVKIKLSENPCHYMQGNMVDATWFKNTAALCMHLTPDNGPKIRKLQATIAEAQAELDAISGDMLCQ